jgi:hypothetical protein
MDPWIPGKARWIVSLNQLRSLCGLCDLSGESLVVVFREEKITAEIAEIAEGAEMERHERAR